MTNVDIVTFALGELGGVERIVHLEHIAVKAYGLSPGAFRWDLHDYSEYVDKDKVRVSLTDAQKPKYGSLVTTAGAKRSGLSKPTDAWQMTKAGARWYATQGPGVASVLGVSRPSLKRSKEIAVRKRVTGSDLYAVYVQTGRVNKDSFAFADLLECSPDASNDVMRERYNSLSGQVELVDDLKLVQFLEATAREHADMLT